jgi:hypothetical protein
VSKANRAWTANPASPEKSGRTAKITNLWDSRDARPARQDPWAPPDLPEDRAPEECEERTGKTDSTVGTAIRDNRDPWAIPDRRVPTDKGDRMDRPDRTPKGSSVTREPKENPE